MQHPSGFVEPRLRAITYTCLWCELHVLRPTALQQEHCIKLLLLSSYFYVLRLSVGTVALQEFNCDICEYCSPVTVRTIPVAKVVMALIIVLASCYTFNFLLSLAQAIQKTAVL